MKLKLDREMVLFSLKIKTIDEPNLVNDDSFSGTNKEKIKN